MSAPRFGLYEVPSPELKDKLQEMARYLKTQLPPGWQFSLFPMSEGPQGLPNEGSQGATFYLSSAERQSMIRALKEFIRKEERHG